MTARKRPIDPRTLAVRDNVPAGAVVSLAEIPDPLSFASIFRDELAARGLGLAKPKEKRGGRPELA